MAIPVTAALLILPAIFGLLAPTTLADNHLLSGESLGPGKYINQAGWALVMQEDCNLVFNDVWSPLWSSGTKGKGQGCRLNLQKDGNLVIVDKNNNRIWESNTARGDGFYILVVQHDRNVVIYGDPTFATATNAVSAGVTVIPGGSLTATAAHALNDKGEVTNRKIDMVVNQ